MKPIDKIGKRIHFTIFIIAFILGLAGYSLPASHYGDVNGDGTVNAHDAELVLQDAVRSMGFTPQQQVLADVSGNGDVSAYDAALISHYSVGSMDSFPVEGGGRPPTNIGSSESAVEVSIPTDLLGHAGGNVTVPINISDTTGITDPSTGLGIISFDIILTYEPSVLMAIDAVLVDTIASGWIIAYNPNITCQEEEGRLCIDIGMIGFELNGAGVFVNINFSVLETAGHGTISQISFSELKLNDGHISATTTDGEITLDNIAPETSISLEGDEGETVPQGQNDWWTSDVKVTLSATDDDSGLKEIRYKINEGVWEMYSEPFIITGSTVYYEAEDNAGSVAAKSQEIKIDKTIPSTPVVTDDGEYTMSLNQLHATWVSVDAESDVPEYQYAIGTIAGGTELVDWTSTGTSTEVTVTNLILDQQETYYFAVKARNGAGLWSEVGVSDGIKSRSLVIGASCPVNLLITDPKGRQIGIDENGTSYDEIPGAEYISRDFDGDDEEDVEILIPNALTGNYSIEVIPKLGANLTDTYTLYVTTGEGSITLDEDRQIQNIPLESYVYFLAQISMKAGWNLVSIPVQLVSNDLHTVLQSIEGHYNSVWRYDAESGSWQRYIVGGPGFLNNLETIESGKGYWIDMVDFTPLTLDGDVVDDEPIPLAAGWNLVGYNSLTAQLLQDALLSIAENYSSVWTYDAEAGGWQRYIVDGPDFLNNLETMDPAKGYWVNALGDCTLSVDGGGLAAPAYPLDLSVQLSPKVSQLHQNYPNPFNPDTWIPYQLKEDADVAIRIYSAAGQLVRTLDLGHKEIGFYTNKEKAVYWNGKNEAGEHVVSGIYFCSIEAGDFTTTRKMVIMR